MVVVASNTATNFVPQRKRAAYQLTIIINVTVKQMDFAADLTPSIRQSLFPSFSTTEISLSRVVVLNDGSHYVGISISKEMQFVVAFLRVVDQVDGDTDLIEQLATAWTTFREGYRLTPDARIIKFSRAEATHDAFDPLKWSLPHPKLIWKLERALILALRLYATHSSKATQFYYLPQSSSLERWYARLERQLCRKDPTGPTFQIIAKPAAHDGGFHGYERIQVQEAIKDPPPGGGCASECQLVEADERSF